MGLTYLFYALVLGESLVLSLLLVPVAMRLAHRWDFLDRPGPRKVHAAPKPLLGGAAIFAAFYLVILGNLSLLLLAAQLPLEAGLPGRLVAEAQQYITGVYVRLPPLVGFLLGGAVVFGLGLVDDKYGMRPAVKISGQVVAAALLFASGVRVEFGAELGQAHLIDRVVVPAVLTVGWIVLLSNSFNLLDNMDGLCGGVAVIALAFFAVIAQIMEGQRFIVLVLCALIGAIAGFLRYNLYPSRIFMGDAGSMFIGYCVGSLTILSTFFIPKHTETRLALLIPLYVMAVPLFDTISVVAIRLRRGLPIYQGDTNHFSHRLVALGFSQRNAVLLIYLVTVCTGLGAVVLHELPFRYGMLLLVQVVVIFAIIALLEGVRR